MAKIATPKPYKKYKWIVKDRALLGGKLAIKGTRLSVSLILECFASGMSEKEINKAFGGIYPSKATHEVLMVAAELADAA